MESRQYMVFNISEVELINFDEVLQTSAETLRKSNDNTKAFVKWEGRIVSDSVDPSLNRPALDENGQIVEIESEISIESNQESYIPESVKALTTKEGPYTHAEILAILASPEWDDPNPIT
jgi:hypothetical protein